MRNLTPDIDSKTFKPSEAYLDTLKSNLPKLDTLFEMLARGQHPDFLAVMEGISEMVAFYVDCDLNQDDPVCRLIKRSQKKCRFCG